MNYGSYKSEMDSEDLEDWAPVKAHDSIQGPSCPVCESNEYVKPLKAGDFGFDEQLNRGLNEGRLAITGVGMGYRWIHRAIIKSLSRLQLTSFSGYYYFCDFCYLDKVV